MFPLEPSKALQNTLRMLWMSPSEPFKAPPDLESPKSDDLGPTTEPEPNLERTHSVKRCGVSALRAPPLKSLRPSLSKLSNSSTKLVGFGNSDYDSTTLSSDDKSPTILDSGVFGSKSELAGKSGIFLFPVSFP